MQRKRIVILGFGQRGAIYAGYGKRIPDEFEVAAIVDNDETRAEKARREYVCPVFTNYRDFLRACIPADIVAVGTQDNDHSEHALACMRAGYDILLEKPIATTLKECLKIRDESVRLKRKVIVCHVLRYTPFYKKIKEILDSGAIGNIVTLNASENVGYFHQAHSFVRGPWRNGSQSCPMILAKCCHDMDIIRWLIGKSCRRVSSIGGLSEFKAENAPAGSREFCSDCSLDCIYNAQKLYTDHRGFANYFYTEKDDSLEGMLRTLEKGQYDRCVYRCDNDVVDHQNTVMLFESGVTASHVMTAFSREIYRDIKIHGTRGELTGVMETGRIEVRTFGGDVTHISVDLENVAYGGHGGGDMGLMHEVYLQLNGVPCKSISYIDVSLDSHKMAFAAERSRRRGGSVVVL